MWIRLRSRLITRSPSYQVFSPGTSRTNSRPSVSSSLRVPGSWVSHRFFHLPYRRYTRDGKVGVLRSGVVVPCRSSSVSTQRFGTISFTSTRGRHRRNETSSNLSVLESGVGSGGFSLSREIVLGTL